MNKGLEAFNRILGNDYFNLIITSRTNGKKQYANDVAIVKEELKRLEELDNGAYVSIHINRYNELCDKEKALEIIKKKKLVKNGLLTDMTLEQYNRCALTFGDQPLTQDEYDLLKEILL